MPNIKILASDIVGTRRYLKTYLVENIEIVNRSFIRNQKIYNCRLPDTRAHNPLNPTNIRIC